MNSKAKGEISEAVIVAELLKQEYSVSIPFGNNQRYDLLVDDGEKIERAQCKTGRIRNGCVLFSTSSTNGFTGAKTHYQDQIEAFFVYCPDNEKIYKVPIEKTPKTSMQLRIEKAGPKAPVTTINWAKDYEI